MNVYRQDIKVVGVTFDNDDGINRQTILRELDESIGGMYFDADMQLQRYEYFGNPAYYVLIESKIVGNLPAALAREVAEKEDAGYDFWLDDLRIVGGPSEIDEDDELDDDQLGLYGVRATLCWLDPKEFAKEQNVKREAERPDAASKKQNAKPKQKGIWKLVLGGMWCFCGLAHFGRNTFKMIMLILLGAAFVFWWMLSDWKLPEDRQQ